LIGDIHELKVEIPSLLYSETSSEYKTVILYFQSEKFPVLKSKVRGFKIRKFTILKSKLEEMQFENFGKMAFMN
jgi:hypothetical protein